MSSLTQEKPNLKTQLKSIVGGSIGNMIEWYDWYAYSVFSLYFAGSFFPKDNETAQLLNTAGIFAIGFLMRPVGGWIMGAYADRKGRKAALTLSVLLMSAGSLMITFVPNYEKIGLAAPLILVLARMIQGISIGGEYGTAATYLSEMAPPHQRGFYSSFQYVSTTMGQLIALAILLVLQRFLLTEQQLSDWGWRIPFGIGAILAVSAIYLRKEISETDSFQQTHVKAEQRGTFKELLRYKRESLLVVGFTIGLTVAYYTFTTYMQKFLVNTAGFSKNESTTITVITLILFMLVQPLFGALGDKIGRKRQMIIYGSIGVCTSIPILTWLGETQNFWMATGLITLALLITSLCTSISAIIKAEMFPANVRSLGVSFPYALAVALFGGTAEYVALLFKNAGHAHWFYWYLTGCLAVSLIVSINMRDTEKHSQMSES
ncbi:MFS transporter [Siphonobacter sp. SORGH_AS_0500]|uniref:MFS transporter n=1 Tax=Siphonobacter sp. SORGH_AS_0500 TaxID=1864824 RepID=UPI00285F29AE|nr:MFS transporter [Siphonobacter sp. SORGH_AS_0500]MDR6197439.1 MHS family alpha-ketoglutarate permease-like MFS transporter [Siphonobacter sp. SORGH_AS_0500]